MLNALIGEVCIILPTYIDDVPAHYRKSTHSYNGYCFTSASITEF